MNYYSNIIYIMFFKIKDSHKKMFLQHTLLIIFFAAVYYFTHLYIIKTSHNKDGGLVRTQEDKHKGTSISFFDCLRFSLVTQTTVGYGALVPTHSVTQIINVVQLMTIYGVIILSFM